jgi:hypothetical protein
MTDVQFNHMELTFARGTLDDTARADIDAFYGDVFGWIGKDTTVLGQSCHLLLAGAQFILLAESDTPIASPGYDHLGLLVDTFDSVDELLERCRRYHEKDPRLQLKEYDDFVVGPVTQHTFYVRYLLPIWFDVHAIRRSDDPGARA